MPVNPVLWWTGAIVAITSRCQPKPRSVELLAAHSRPISTATRSKNTIADVTLAESLPVQSRNTVAAPSATAS